MNYSYPGNIRELENIIERAVVLGGEGIVPEHLPENVRNARSESVSESKKNSTTIIQLSDVELPAKLEDILENIERAYLEAALKESGGVKKRAAEMLGINFRSIRYRLSKFGLGEDEVR
jgi:two-component system response regulator PilR (NtrC family)